MFTYKKFIECKKAGVPFNRMLIFLLTIPILYVFVIDGEAVKEYMPDIVNEAIFAANQFFKSMQSYVQEFIARNLKL